MKKLLITAVLLWQSMAFGQTYPAQPVHLVVPFAAGSSTDILGRLLADELRNSLGGTWVVENRAGAGGIIGAQAVAAAAADGYTLLLSSSATNSAAPGLYKNVPYDAFKSFAHIGRSVLYPWALVVNPTLPVSNVSQFIEFAKVRPGQLNFAYGSATAQVAASTFNQAAGVNAVGVSYKSQPPAMTDLIAGTVQYMMADIALVNPNVKAGRLKVLGVTTRTPTATMADVPPIAESSLPNYELVGWAGLAAPAGTPPEILNRLSSELEKIMGSPRIRDLLIAMGTEPAYLGRDSFERFVASELDLWTKRLRDVGVEKQ